MSVFRKKDKNLSFGRLYFLGFVFFLIFTSLVWRLFDLQVLKGKENLLMAKNQRYIEKEITPDRGTIYVIDRTKNNALQEISVNETKYFIYIVPKEITNPEYVAKVLLETFPELDEELLKKRIYKKNDPFEPVIHKVSSDVAEYLESLNIEGVYRTTETVRTYPYGEIMAHITGFLGYGSTGRVGQYGVEGYFDKFLLGVSGYSDYEKGASGSIITVSQGTYIPATDGANIILTIDPNVQQRVCDTVKQAISDYEAESGSIIVANPETGEIISMCSYPSYDPNNYSDVEDINTYINPAVSKTYEPGSVFKPITVAIGLDTGSVSADDTFVDKGYIEFDDYVIRNSANKVYGESNISRILEQSINTGSVFVALQTGREDMRKYVEKFGFGKKTGIELYGEVKGDISSFSKRGDIYLATGSFGQGITVTPIQLIQAFSAIANGGEMPDITVVDKVIFSEDKVFEGGKKDNKKQIISQKTSMVLTAMLVNVIEKGQASKAKVDGYYFAGKTGTAQVAGKGGYLDDTIHSFIGFGPASDPKFVILVKIDKPKKGRYSSSTAAPVFSQIASFLVQYYNIPPEK